jgi:Domain of unknown function (DUF397)
MTEKHKPAPTTQQPELRWQKSSFSPETNCVEVAQLPDGTVAVRNSNHPDAGTLHFTPSEMAAWIDGCTAGEFEHLKPLS